MTKIKKIGKDGLEHEYWQLDEADKIKLREQAEKRKAERAEIEAREGK